MIKVGGCCDVECAANGDTKGSHGSVESPIYSSGEKIVSHEQVEKGESCILYKSETSFSARSGIGGTSANSSSLWLISGDSCWLNKASAFGCAVTGTTKLTSRRFTLSVAPLANLRARLAARFPPAEAPHSPIRSLSILYFAAFLYTLVTC